MDNINKMKNSFETLDNILMIITIKTFFSIFCYRVYWTNYFKERLKFRLSTKFLYFTRFFQLFISEINLFYLFFPHGIVARKTVYEFEVIQHHSFESHLLLADDIGACYTNFLIMLRNSVASSEIFREYNRP